MPCGIYKYENKINHKVYIGQTIDLEARHNKHKLNVYDSKKQNYLYKAIRKYSWNNFTYEILESFEEYNPELLNKLEKKYIIQYNSLIPNGYNMDSGGSNGAGLAKGKPVEQYNLQGKFIKEYASAHEATRQTGINYSSICACCREEKQHVKGFQWKYKNSNKQIKHYNNQDVIIRKSKIWQFDLNGNFIKEYSSLQELNKQTGFHKATISKVCNHKGWSAQNFLWCFENDYEWIEKCKLKKGKRKKNINNK